jgi:hypothetical protein
MLPSGANYSLVHNIKANGLSTTKVNNFLTSFNVHNLDLKSKMFNKINHEVNDNLIKVKDKSVKYWRCQTPKNSVIASDGTYPQNVHAAQYCFTTGIATIQKNLK